jgi:hypothetical protein
MRSMAIEELGARPRMALYHRRNEGGIVLRRRLDGDGRRAGRAGTWKGNDGHRRAVCSLSDRRDAARPKKNSCDGETVDSTQTYAAKAKLARWHPGGHERGVARTQRRATHVATKRSMVADASGSSAQEMDRGRPRHESNVRPTV